MFNGRTLSVNEPLKQQLKNPLGTLIVGTFDKCNSYLRSRVAEENTRPLILVGDTISRNAASVDVYADVIILDNKEMREKSPSTELLANRKQFQVSNPHGYISKESWSVIDQAIKSGNSAVVVDGEEDLLALVATYVAPIGSLIVYGQPKMGIVLVTVTSQKKGKVNDLMKLMNAISTS